MPIKISELIIEEQMAYSITEDNTTKGRDLNIYIINCIHRIKRQNICQYTCFKLYKHLASHKGEYFGHIKPAITDNTTIDQTEAHQNKQHNITENDGRTSET